MYILNKLLLTLVCVVVSTCIAFAKPLEPVVEASSVADRTVADVTLPTYVIVLGESYDHTDLSVPDSLFNEIAGTQIFKVNRTDLNYNDPFISKLRDVVLPMANREGWTLVGIDLRGGASPEGPYANNVRLARGRAEALRRYMCNNLDTVVPGEIVIRMVPEDYHYLLWRLERVGDSAAPLLRRIIDECGDDDYACIKPKLQALYGGKYWQRLLRDYYPHLRAARVVLFFRRTRPVEPAEKSDIVGNTAEVQLPVEVAAIPELDPFPVELERRHALSVSSNILYDAFYMPQYGWAPMVNIAAEWFPRHSNWTLRAQFTWPYYHRWGAHKFFQIRDYHIEARRYFSPGWLNTGLYAGAYVNATKYGIGLSAKKGWQGEGGGAALKIGYVLPLGSGRWRLDFHAAVGAFITRYDPYVYGNPVTGDTSGDDYWYDWIGSPDDFKRRNHRFTWFGPTEVGITLSYDLLFYRIRHSGVSFLRNETIK